MLWIQVEVITTWVHVLVIQQEVWSQNYASWDKSEFVEAISLNGQNIHFALKENAIHRRSKPEDLSTESTIIGLDFLQTTLVGITGKRK
jgi:hypothetical protein